jgi:formate hydrogenlyase subunit 6/NADH:ubiquinone oxidoreductase subunit I
MSVDYLPQIDPARCTGCGLCVKLCPSHALSMINGIATFTAQEECNYSGTCQEICPTEAISLEYVIVFSEKSERSPS